MRKVRYGLFETNSSSIHTIAIPCDYEDVEVPEKVYLRHGEFGWDQKEYDDPQSKISYMFEVCIDLTQIKVYAKKCLADPNIKNQGEWWASYWRRILERLKYDDYVERFKELLREMGVKEIQEYSSGEGYVDHGDSWANEFVELFDDVEKMKQFLFNDKAVISTGNDNDEYSSPHYASHYSYPITIYEKFN